MSIYIIVYVNIARAITDNIYNLYSVHIDQIKGDFKDILIVQIILQ